jgi:UDP-glucose 4-epimerase
MSIKRVLITGSNSYVGTNVENWLMKEPDKFYVETISVRGDAWKSFDFSKFDVVFHVAGIAHVKETKKNRDLYFKVNRDLAFEIAKVAKNSGIKHFIFISSMSVFGKHTGSIDQYTKTIPDSNYSRSKLEAENLIEDICEDDFKVLIIRPPVIYGKNSPGNYSFLSKNLKYFFIFPLLHSFKSMIFIDNFCEFILISIKNSLTGFYHPQNQELISVKKLVNTIALFQKRNLILVNFGFFSKLFFLNSLGRKLFTSTYYDSNISDLNLNYNLVSFVKSIEIIEKN